MKAALGFNLETKTFDVNISTENRLISFGYPEIKKLFGGHFTH